jgi:hypothetical protein
MGNVPMAIAIVCILQVLVIWGVAWLLGMGRSLTKAFFSFLFVAALYFGFVFLEPFFARTGAAGSIAGFLVFLFVSPYAVMKVYESSYIQACLTSLAVFLASGAAQRFGGLSL